MARSFDVPVKYRSELVSRIKTVRRTADPLKKDLSPSILDFGPVRFKLARHFGFCYGVENAIEIAYRALEENPDKRIFLLSEMIHNPHVNEDLQSRGIRFLRTTSGEQLIPFSELASDDVVIIPAFGTTLEIENKLLEIGIDVQSYDTTCPFVEKVWRRAGQIGGNGYSVIVHGKRSHEETQATFSHAAHGLMKASIGVELEAATPVFVVRDLSEATYLSEYIKGEHSAQQLLDRFPGQFSDNFSPERDLTRIGVVNQTTMLATETAEIVTLLKAAMVERYGRDQINDRFADTSDTLCYATNENQDAALALIKSGGKLAIVVGGSNSSNTSHLVELCEVAMPTYFIRSAAQIGGVSEIQHFDINTGQDIVTSDWLDTTEPVDIILTAGASCPDILLDEVIQTVTALVPEARSYDSVLDTFPIS
ncbi:MAG: 4-hydroxy-3-methylbut-2-enyl diphosphate reductase [Bacteroidetes bacterium]|nr:MAG: 4-hydroxy-3-methylbut-2-enyl diphosphate reductase [Bacteroidota bacterium]